MRLQDIAKGGGDSKLTVLSEEELKSLHNVLLEILDDLHQICAENGLRYVLIGGSAIGALRSGGIIPWDDDIDIGMSFNDMKKFIKIAPLELSNNLFLQTPETENTRGAGAVI